MICVLYTNSPCSPLNFLVIRPLYNTIYSLQAYFLLDWDNLFLTFSKVDKSFLDYFLHLYILAPIDRF